MATPNLNPAFDELADDDDTLDWNRAEHGLMSEAATGSDEEPLTESLIALKPGSFLAKKES